MIASTTTRVRGFGRAMMKACIAMLAALLLACGAGAVQAYADDGLAVGVAASTESAKTVQAQKATAYKVAFNANGGKGAMKAQTVQRGKSTVLSANKFTRSGYKFIGWNTKANGKGKSYKNKAKVKNLAKAGKTVTLYAQWKKTAKEKVSYLASYKPVLSSAVSRTGDYSMFNGASLSYYVHQYALWDIDKDGVKELIVHVGFDGKAFRGVNVYTIKSGKAKLAGTFAPGYGDVVVSSKGKLYIHVNASVAENYTLVNLRGAKATGKVVFEEYLPYTSDSVKKIRAFEKKAGLSGRNTVAKSRITWSDISSVKLLKCADKAK